jgi:hypothetical protein
VRTCRRDTPSGDAPRAHPWTDAPSSAAHRYRDFKASPQLVRTALEDFTPWDGRKAIETFYRLVEWMNEPDGAFESNDCEFTGPHDDAAHPPKSQECSGRLMILFRDLPHNLSHPRVEALERAVHLGLAALDRDFEWGIVGTTIMRTRYVELPGGADGPLGYQLMLSFWAWGDTDDETMGNLDRLLGNLSEALRGIERHESQDRLEPRMRT